VKVRQQVSRTSRRAPRSREREPTDLSLLDVLAAEAILPAVGADPVVHRRAIALDLRGDEEEDERPAWVSFADVYRDGGRCCRPSWPSGADGRASPRRRLLCPMQHRPGGARCRRTFLARHESQARWLALGVGPPAVDGPLARLPSSRPSSESDMSPARAELSRWRGRRGGEKC
jgi:hypothetical protein